MTVREKSEVEQSTGRASLLSSGTQWPFGRFNREHHMNAKPFLLCFISVSAAFAADPPGQYNATTLQPIPYSDPSRWRTLLIEKRDSPLIVLGKSDFTISSPLIEGLRPLRHAEGLSRGQRFLRLPVIRWFVPGPMEKPPGGTGHYFAWRNCDLPWTEAASRPGIVKGPR